jgi:hypothetical protein
VQYFLEKRRTGKEAYAFISKKIRHWAKGNQDLREGSAIVLTWLRAACTKDPAHPEYSSLDTITRPIHQDAETTTWTVAQLHAIVPRPEPRPPTPPPVLASGSVQPPADMTQTQTAALCERIMALSDTILTGQVNRERTRETTKTLSVSKMRNTKVASWSNSL